MARTGEDWRPDFEQTLGESFGEAVVPPVEFEDASPHECCEAVWAICGRDVTPRVLSQLTDLQIEDLSRSFGEHFDCEPPAVEQIRAGIEQTLARWPVGSLGE